MQSTYEIAVI